MAHNELKSFFEEALNFFHTQIISSHSKEKEVQKLKIQEEEGINVEGGIFVISTYEEGGRMGTKIFAFLS